MPFLEINKNKINNGNEYPIPSGLIRQFINAAVNKATGLSFMKK
jgi:hypothetical protein